MDGEKISSILNGYNIPVCDIAVRRGDTERLFQFRSRGKREGPGLYLIYSVTKMFVAAMVMMLAQQGRVTTEARLAHWFPSIKGAGDITLRMLLNHTSGIPDYGTLPEYHKAVQRQPLVPWTLEEFIERTMIQDRVGRPGEKFHYSNLGYRLLVEIIRSVSGRDIADVLRTDILMPCGLTNTNMAAGPEDLYYLVPAMSQELNAAHTPLDVRTHYHPGWVAHGVMTSTASDVAKFLEKLFRGEIIGPTALQAMQEVFPLPEPHNVYSERGYGLGMMTGKLPAGTFHGHGGGGPGYSLLAGRIESEHPANITLLAAHEDYYAVEQAFAAIAGITAGG